MFNPTEYTVSKSNSFKEDKKQKGQSARAEFEKVGSQSLKLSLIFDSYEKGEDVSKETRKLWEFMKPKEQKTSRKKPKDIPVQVAFEWGVFRSVAYIVSLTQQFTMFTHEGVPVRAKVDVNFTQYTEREDYQELPTNPTSGGGAIEQIWVVKAGDRLDNIAAKVYEEATEWKRIAEHNRLINPLALRPGQILRIPLE
jgi:nucleoid-associated protein YgaU